MDPKLNMKTVEEVANVFKRGGGQHRNCHRLRDDVWRFEKSYANKERGDNTYSKGRSTSTRIAYMVDWT